MERFDIGEILILIFVAGVIIEFLYYLYCEIKLVIKDRRERKARRAMWPELYRRSEERYLNGFNDNKDKGDRIDNGPITKSGD